MEWLKDKVSIVTGGARGIGKSIALKLAEAGSHIAIFDIEEAKDCAEEVEKIGRRCLTQKVDVSQGEEVTKSVEEVYKAFGKIDILVNNAGITRDNLLLRMKEEDWDKVMSINLKGAFHCCKAVVKYMIKQKEGCIVNIASIIGIVGNLGQVNYAASKGGLISFTKSLAKELAPWGIRVNAVAPGFIKTAMTDKLKEEVKEKLLDSIPLRRTGLPEEVANVVFFLVSPLSSYITGEVIKVDGGMAM